MNTAHRVAAMRKSLSAGDDWRGVTAMAGFTSSASDREEISDGQLFETM